MAPADDVGDNSDGGDHGDLSWKYKMNAAKFPIKLRMPSKFEGTAERKETKKTYLEINENRMWWVIVRDGGRRIRAHADALPRKKQAEEPKWLDENLIILLG